MRQGDPNRVINPLLPTCLVSGEAKSGQLEHAASPAITCAVTTVHIRA